MGADDLCQSAMRHYSWIGAHLTCAPFFCAGNWDVVVLPASHLFTSIEWRQATPQSALILATGSAHQMKSAWRCGIHDFLREPWTPDELFLRVRGPQPRVVRWSWSGHELSLDGNMLTCDGSSRMRLPGSESEILRLLVGRSGMPVSRSLLAWNSGCTEGRVIDTLVSRLRRRVCRLVGTDFCGIQALRGIGYVLS